MYDGNPKLLIVDDEAPARARLRDMVQEIGGWNILDEAENGSSAVQICTAQSPDVVLLDIRMPGMDGMEVARQLSAMPVPPAIVFTTAYDEYAVSAFETNAVGYLLKPIRRERLLRALEQAVRLSRMKLADMARNAPELCARTIIPVASQGKIRWVPVAEVSGFHADQKYVRMIHKGGEDLIDESLKNLEEEFAADFVRAHRNSLLRISSIASIEKDSFGQSIARMIDAGPEWPISRRHLAGLKQRVG